MNSYTGHHKNVLEQVPCARGVAPKCSDCALHRFLKHWEGTKRQNWVISDWFHRILEIVCHYELPSWEIHVFSVWFYVSIGWLHPLQRGALEPHIRVFELFKWIHVRWFTLEGTTGLYRLTIEFVHRVLLSNCSHCLLLWWLQLAATIL